jgi:3-hydroxypropanoate dehydrogenase
MELQNDVARADRVFLEARTYNAWKKEPVPERCLRDLYELVRWGPTSANCLPLRILFVQSSEAKATLADLAAPPNAPKILAAPVTAILGYDTQFYKNLPRLFPHNPSMADMYSSNAKLSEETAFRNSSIQGGYFIVAARMLGLDCGPMSGFDNEKVDELFFSDGRTKSNFLCSVGYGDNTTDFWDRLPRLEFEEACSFE